jgi:hypothetical protein
MTALNSLMPGYIVSHSTTLYQINKRDTTEGLVSISTNTYVFNAKKRCNKKVINMVLGPFDVSD